MGVFEGNAAETARKIAYATAATLAYRLTIWYNFTAYSIKKGLMIMRITLTAIGTVQNKAERQKDTGWGATLSHIVIDPVYEQGLCGLSDFSHIVVVYYLDKASFDAAKHLVRRPQGRADMPKIGIFSQRAKDRPNPIGITAVKLAGIQDNIITVQGLDAIHGTPVLDIKPYYPMYDCKPDATVPAWVNILMKDYF